MDLKQPPSGYRRTDEASATIVAREDVADAVAAAYRSAPTTKHTLHGFAATCAGARPLQGRETAYALTLPNSTMAVVVRHNRHGGVLRHLTGDLFLSPTRAPDELELAIKLQALGIPTPAVVAYGVYPAPFGLARSDVVTEEITGGVDLGAVLLRTRPESIDRINAWSATVELLTQLAAAGVRHHDLNVKNVLLKAGARDGFVGHALDVDRAELGLASGAAAAGNVERLTRSVEKLRRLFGAAVTDEEVAALRRTATSTP